jgi:hypothetical protein
VKRFPGVDALAFDPVRYIVFVELENSDPKRVSLLRILAFVHTRGDFSTNRVVLDPVDHCGIVNAMFDIILSSDFAPTTYTGACSFPPNRGIPLFSKGVL